MMERLLQLLARFGFFSGGSIHYIGGSDILPPPLKGVQEQEALEALEQGDERSKQQLIELRDGAQNILTEPVHLQQLLGGHAKGDDVLLGGGFSGGGLTGDSGSLTAAKQCKTQAQN